MVEIIRTVNGDIPPEAAGVTYCHEHLVLDSPLIELRFPHIHLNDDDKAAAEIEGCTRVGVRSMVDAMPCSAGRSASRLASLAEATGVNIIAATGLHHDRYYGPAHWTNSTSAEALAELFIADIAQGIDRFDYTGPTIIRTDHRAGVIKVATSGANLDDRDERILTAASIAHGATGAPVLTHCEDGEGGGEQVAFLTALGVPASSIILSHIDKNGSIERLADLSATGAYVEFDQSLRQVATPQAPSVNLIAAAVEMGMGSRIVLGTDGARRSLWSAWGGERGLAWLYSHYSELLVEAGISRDLVDDFFVKNPAAALGFEPVNA